MINSISQLFKKEIIYLINILLTISNNNKIIVIIISFATN